MRVDRAGWGSVVQLRGQPATSLHQRSAWMAVGGVGKSRVAFFKRTLNAAPISGVLFRAPLELRSPDTSKADCSMGCRSRRLRELVERKIAAISSRCMLLRIVVVCHRAMIATAQVDRILALKSDVSPMVMSPCCAAHPT